jgi:peptidoglycan-associated lipoprotein
VAQNKENTGMNLLLKMTIFIAVLGLGACAQSGYLGDAPINGTGAAGDPNSVAYFNQTLGDRVLFVVNESTLSSEAQRILDDQADWMLRNMEYSALIEGHADEQGTREYNLALGARRAASVEAYLVSRGISASRLNTISYGKERPIEICSAESCYAQNRRAVTVLSAGAGS